ncbi:MAG: T9SS type A sorting domain-containing protein, partial [Cyclobacteriaceae bacterium]
PLQSNSTSGCNLNTTSCENVNMVQNYMDYSDDDCMNVFTNDQKDRMRIVAENGYRRKSLLTSPGLIEPQVFNQDLGIVPVPNAPPILCSEDIIPEILLINYGLENVENYSVGLYVNDVLQEEISATSTLNSLQTTTVRFSEISLNLNQVNTLRYALTGTDENPINNQLIIAYPNSQSSLLPFEEDFEDGNNSLIREIGSNWNVSNAPDSTAINNALKIEYFNTDLPFGQMDYLVTELLDVSALNSAELSFSYAYSGRTSDVINDGLIVGIIPSCGNSLDIRNIVFERYGRRLITTSAQETAYTPFGPSEWEKSSFNITPYLGEGLIQIVFIGVNGGGNNIYLDNIEVTSAELERLDLGIRKIEGVTPTTCQKEVFPKIEFKNFGYEDIESLDLDIMINERVFKQNYQNIKIFSGFSESFSLSIRSLTDGENDISIKIDKINGEVDTKLNNNIISFKVVVNESEEIIPVRETFDQPKWTTNFTENSPTVDLIQINNSEVAKFNAFGSTYVGGSSYISSPILKTNNQREGAIRIKYSYASRNGFNDRLKVFLSNNCGRTHEIEVFNQDSEDLAIRKSEDDWVPESDTDWEYIFIDVSEHLIWEELRVLVEFQNGGGNNLYIDDIEFLTDNDPEQLSFESRLTVFPNPAVDEFYVNVNMPLKETLHIQLIDMAGKVVFDQNFPNSLNQTYRMIAPSQSGFYLLKVNGNQIKQTKRLYIRP